MPLPPQNNRRDALEELFTEEPTPKDKQIEELQQSLAEERDARAEERFYWLTAVVILVDLLAAPNVGAAFFPIFMLEVVILLALAHKFGIDPVVILLQRLFDKLLKRADGQGPG